MQNSPSSHGPISVSAVPNSVEDQRGVELLRALVERDQPVRLASTFGRLTDLVELALQEIDVEVAAAHPIE